jgi:cysteinyl-tRNA synthetase
MVGPVIFDAIKRYLRSQGFEVTWVVNITDVEDKLIDAAQKQASRAGGESTPGNTSKSSGAGIDTIDAQGDRSHRRDHRDVRKLIAKARVRREGTSIRRHQDTITASSRIARSRSRNDRAGRSAGKRNRRTSPVEGRQGEPSWDSPWGKGRPAGTSSARPCR